jgi:hypothetical protein
MLGAAGVFLQLSDEQRAMSRVRRSMALLALVVPCAVSAQVVQKPTIAFEGSNAQHGATFTEEIRKRLAVVFTVNPDGPRRWGAYLRVLDPYRTPMVYSVTYVDNCNGRWCWRYTLTGVCNVGSVKECADSVFDRTMDFVNQTPQ